MSTMATSGGGANDPDARHYGVRATAYGLIVGHSYHKELK